MTVYYPPAGEWETREPAEQGMDPEKIDSTIEYILDHESEIPKDFAGHEESLGEVLGPLPERRGDPNGLILKDGYIVAEWGDTHRVDQAFSVTKSFLSTVAGLAYKEGLIESVHDPVSEYVEDGGFADPHNAKATWHHFLQNRSEWRGTLFDKPDQADRREGKDRDLHEPGDFWEYNDVRVNRLALSLLRIWGRPLPEVLREKVMKPVGSSDSWEWHGYENSYVQVDGDRIQSVSGGGHWGGGLWINSRDLARWGLMMLRNGQWQENQILTPEWMDMATTPCPLHPGYGYLLWLNSNREQWPNSPESCFAALGSGFNVVLVAPEHSLVAVVRWYGGRQGVYEGEEKRRRQDTLIHKLTDAVVDT